MAKRKPISSTTPVQSSRFPTNVAENMSAEVEIIDLESKPILASRGRTKDDAIPVDLHDYDRALQHAILASLRTSSSSTPPPSVNVIDLTNDDAYFHSSINVFTLSNTPKRKRKLRAEIGQSSSNPKNSPEPEPFVCQICFEPKPLTESFNVQGCVHVYCKECMSSYVAAKLQDNVTHITCPSIGCHGMLEPYYCREIIPLDVFERWGNVLCESLFAGSEKFYCPFKDCSALLINDAATGGITESECPHCHRLFCAQCKCAWHFLIECSEYQKLGKGENEREDIMLMNLAKDKKWKRCPKCKIFVEKSAGCMYMKCRSAFGFSFLLILLSFVS